MYSTNCGPCEHDAMNKQPPKLQWWFAGVWSPLLCCIAGYRSLICIEAKTSLSPGGADTEGACCEAFLWLEAGVWWGVG